MELGRARWVKGEQFLDGHEAVTQAPQRGQDDELQRPDRLSAVLMHEDDRSRAEMAKDIPCDSIPLGSSPVEAVDVPKHIQHPQSPRHVIDCCVSGSVRRSKDSHTYVSVGQDRASGAFELACDRRRGEAGEIYVRPGVVAQAPESPFAGRQGRPISKQPADEEEGCASVVATEEAKHQVRVTARAVIERQRDRVPSMTTAIDW
jgi:hypothetical protein